MHNSNKNHHKNNHKHTENTNLKVIHWNCFKMTQNRCKELEQFINGNQPDIISLNEVKMNKEEANQFLNINNYSTYYKPRNKNSNYGGGVALIIKNTIEHTESNIINNQLIETLEMKIRVASKEIIIITYYNPPLQTLSRELFESLNSTNLNYILCGDLNANSAASKNGEILENIIIDYNCQIINNKKHTFHRIYNDYTAQLDLILCSPLPASKLIDFEVLETQEMSSDHYPISAVFDLKPKKQDRIKNDQLKFDYKRANWELFKEELEKTTLQTDVSIEEFELNIRNKILDAAMKSVPTFNFKTSNSSLPNNIIELIKERRLIRAEIRKHKKTEDKTKYNKLKKIINEEIKKTREAEWNNFIKKCGKTPLSSKPFWQRINKFRNNKNKNNNIPTLIHNNEQFESNDEKAKLFCSLLKQTFTNNGKFDENFKQKIELEEKKNINLNNKEEQYININLSELKKTVKRLKKSTSPGADNISNEMIKNLPEKYLKYIKELANKSLKECILPENWKTAQMTMIPKKGPKNDPNNYRSISLTSCIGKLIEKLIENRLSKYLKKNNILINEQSGFRKHRRTTDNLLFLTQKVKEQFNRKKKVCTLLFDISKAFDKVWHAGLLHKLKLINTPQYLINWIRAFLTNRKFYVKINDKISTTEQIEAGTPQGAILSPILFNIYINDIPIERSKQKSFSSLYADDLGVSFIFRNTGRIDDIENYINEYLKRLEEWQQKWRLTMSASKCSYIIFSNSRNNTQSFNFKLNNEMIPKENNPRFLGTTLDRTLCFKTNSQIIKEKCMNRLNIIKILSHASWKLSKQTLINLYKSLIGSILDYSFFVISEISISNLISLQAIQNQAIRLIYRLDYDTSTHTLHEISNLPTVSDRYNELFKRYIEKALTHNPLITQLMDEYIEEIDTIIHNEFQTTPLTYVNELLLKKYAQE